MKPFNVFLIPRWVEEMLGAQGASLSVISDYEALSKLLSQETLVELVAFQAIKFTHSDKYSFNGFSGDQVLLNQWLSTGCPEYELLSTESKRRIDDAQYMIGLKQKILSTAVDGGDDDDGLIVHDLNGQNVGIVVTNDHGRLSNERFYNVLQKVMKVLYRYEKPAIVAQRAIFRFYVETLTRNRTAS